MSDHIPDATKMVCPFCGAEKETAKWYRCGSGVSGHREFECLVREPIWRELTTLRTANAALVEEVKRLEEAGDRMANPAATIADVRAWHEAKEAR